MEIKSYTMLWASVLSTRGGGCRKQILTISNLNSVLLDFFRLIRYRVSNPRTIKARYPENRLLQTPTYPSPVLQIQLKTSHFTDISSLLDILTNSFSMAYRKSIPSSRAAPANYPPLPVTPIESRPDSLVSKTTRRIPGSRIPLPRPSLPSPQMAALGFCSSRPHHPSKIPVSKTRPPPRLVRLVRPPNCPMQSPKKEIFCDIAAIMENPPLTGINSTIESSSFPENTVADHAVAVVLSGVGVQSDATTPGVRGGGCGAVRACRRAFQHMRCW